MTGTLVRMTKSRESFIKEGDLSPFDLETAEKKASNSLNKLVDAQYDLQDAVYDYFDAQAEFRDDPSDETEAGLAVCADDLSYAWSKTQEALSRIAVQMGFDGNEAYQEYMNAQGN